MRKKDRNQNQNLVSLNFVICAAQVCNNCFNCPIQKIFEKNNQLKLNVQSKSQTTPNDYTANISVTAANKEEKLTLTAALMNDDTDTDMHTVSFYSIAAFN